MSLKTDNMTLSIPFKARLVTSIELYVGYTVDDLAREQKVEHYHLVWAQIEQ